jgi:hypothetical protein
MRARIPTLAGAAIVLWGATPAAGPDRSTRYALTVCMPLAAESADARADVSGMFAAISVGLLWRDTQACPTDGLVVTLSYRTPMAERPAAFGYSLPFEGTHIRVFYDRVLGAGESVRHLLAHVLAHEIAHMAQGLDRHSPEGLMKARWTRADLVKMTWHALPFAPEDVALIHAGLAARQSRYRPSGATAVGSGKSEPPSASPARR